MAKKAPRKAALLDTLNADEAATVLRRLLDAHPELRKEAEEISRSLVSEISFQGRAEDVGFAIGALSTEEHYGRSGKQSWGYVEPADAAWEMIEEAVEPFLDDIKRYAKLGMDAEALEACKGVVLGLYQAREGNPEFVQRNEDALTELAGSVVEDWCAGAKGRRFPKDFVDEFVPEWEFLAHSKPGADDGESR